MRNISSERDEKIYKSGEYGIVMNIGQELINSLKTIFNKYLFGRKILSKWLNANIVILHKKNTLLTSLPTNLLVCLVIYMNLILR